MKQHNHACMPQASAESADWNRRMETVIEV
jgi:hypothetical protein